MMYQACQSPQTGEIATSDGAVMISWKDADCGKCEPCKNRRAQRLWVDLADARAEVDRIVGELKMLGINT